MAEKIIGLEKQVVKSISFLNFMVRTVFFSTFIFTVFVGYYAWMKNSESLMITLTERWFTIMVGELIVMGFIQVVKEIFQALVKMAEMKLNAKEGEINDEY